MTPHQTPYERGFRAGLNGIEYLIGDGAFKPHDYLDWWMGWEDGKAARPKQPAWVSDAPPPAVKWRRPHPFVAFKKWADRQSRKRRRQKRHRAPRPQPRPRKETQPQPARRLQYLREVGRLGEVAS